MGIFEALGILLDVGTNREQREAEYLAKNEADWRESFTGTIDEFQQRDAA